MNGSGFASFCCGNCHTEIEATPDMVGVEAECPACGAKLVVPAPPSDGVLRHGPDDERYDTAAMKSRTIRIELGDL